MEGRVVEGGQQGGPGVQQLIGLGIGGAVRIRESPSAADLS